MSARRCWAPAAAALVFAGCSCSESRHDDTGQGGGGTTIWGSVSYATNPTTTSDTGLPKPDLMAPWRGWRLWPYPPDDCAIFVPEDLSALTPPSWTPCPFMTDGCTWADAPWIEEMGIGYLAPFSAAVVGGKAYLTVVRPITKGEWIEALLLRDNAVIGAWRFHAPDSQCTVGGPWLRSDGTAAIVNVRVFAEVAPYVFLGPADTIWAAPARTEVFGPPESALLPDGHAVRSDRLLVLTEHYGRFTVRDLETGATERPEPPGEPFEELDDATPVGDEVYYAPWTGVLSSLWVWSAAGGSKKVLWDNSYTYAQLASDGTHAAWIRGEGYVDMWQFEKVELWTSPIAPGIGLSEPKKLADLPTHAYPEMVVAEGWTAAKITPQETRVYRISDGLERRLPVVDGIAWYGDREGLVIAGNTVWVKTYKTSRPGNDVPYLTRFDIDKLPSP